MIKFSEKTDYQTHLEMAEVFSKVLVKLRQTSIVQTGVGVMLNFEQNECYKSTQEHRKEQCAPK